MANWLKKVFIAIGIIFLLFLFKAYDITFNFFISVIIVGAVIFIASTSKEQNEEKEDMPIPVKQPATITPIVAKTQISKPIGYIPREDAYVSNTKRQLEKVIAKHLQGKVLWTTEAVRGISSRTNFSQFVQVGNKKVEMNVSMNNNGPTQITFPSGKYASIFLDKDLKKTQKPNNPAPKKSEPKKDPAPLTNAEKKGNVIINDEGKPEVKPNYKMIASDWINQNLEYLNKACNDAMIAGGNVVEALLAKDKLPADQEAWEAIGAMLKDQEEIDFYEITENGIIVTIE